MASNNQNTPYPYPGIKMEKIHPKEPYKHWGSRVAIWGGRTPLKKTLGMGVAHVELSIGSPTSKIRWKQILR
jgi:hypothetical protein